MVKKINEKNLSLPLHHQASFSAPSLHGLFEIYSFPIKSKIFYSTYNLLYMVWCVHIRTKNSTYVVARVHYPICRTIYISHLGGESIEICWNPSWVHFPYWWYNFICSLWFVRKSESRRTWECKYYLLVDWVLFICCSHILGLWSRNAWLCFPAYKR